MNDLARYEVLAEAFWQMTGYMAPGKSISPEVAKDDLAERTEAFDKWYKENKNCINAMIKTFDIIFDKGEDE